MRCLGTAVSGTRQGGTRSRTAPQRGRGASAGRTARCWSDGAALRPIGSRPEAAPAAAPRVDGARPAPGRRRTAPTGGPAARPASDPDSDASARPAATSPGPVGAAAAAPTARHARPGAAAPAGGAPSSTGRPADAAPGVVGTATRPDGQGLPTVVVTVADPTGRQEARTTTDGDGRYAVALRNRGHVPRRRGGGRVPAARGAGRRRPGRRHPPRRHALGHVRRARRRPARRGRGRGRGRHADRRAGRRRGRRASRTAPATTGWSGVPDGAYTLTASSAGHQPVAVEPVAGRRRSRSSATSTCRSARVWSARSRRRARAVPSRRRRRRSWTRAAWSSRPRSPTPDGAFAFADLPRAPTRSRRAATPRRRRPCT